jgi:hypothetical protein
VNWNRTYKHFGEVPQNATVEFTFVYSGDKIIRTVSTSCSCSTPFLEKDRITVSMKVGEITGKNEFKRKTGNITVEFHDDTKNILELEAIVVNGQYKLRDAGSGPELLDAESSNGYIQAL